MLAGGGVRGLQRFPCPASLLTDMLVAVEALFPDTAFICAPFSSRRLSLGGVGSAKVVDKMAVEMSSSPALLFPIPKFCNGLVSR